MYASDGSAAQISPNSSKRKMLLQSAVFGINCSKLAPKWCRQTKENEVEPWDYPVSLSETESKLRTLLS